MDILSYSKAKKVAKRKKAIETTLGDEVQGEFDTVRDRVDALEDEILAVTRLNDEVDLRNYLNKLKLKYKKEALGIATSEDLSYLIEDNFKDTSGLNLNRSEEAEYEEETQSVSIKPEGFLEMKSFQIKNTEGQFYVDFSILQENQFKIEARLVHKGLTTAIRTVRNKKMFRVLPHTEYSYLIFRVYNTNPKEYDDNGVQTNLDTDSIHVNNLITLWR